MKIMSVTTLCLSAFVLLLMWADYDKRPEVSVFRWFGFRFNWYVFKQMWNALFLNSVLFAGELFQLAKGMTYSNYRHLDLTTFKNLLYAPFLEEFIYRVCLINMFIESGHYSSTTCVLVLPCFFAISHLHHVIVQQYE